MHSSCNSSLTPCIFRVNGCLTSFILPHTDLSHRHHATERAHWVVPEALRLPPGLSRKATKEEGQGTQVAVKVGTEPDGHQRKDLCQETLLWKGAAQEDHQGTWRKEDQAEGWRKNTWRSFACLLAGSWINLSSEAAFFHGQAEAKRKSWQMGCSST